MSTPSSSTRGPSSGPGSQVISSVIKFRCLFTYDLRRKSKRWRDGYLKYHAFNKRVMVYDEHANYVGDHHWRSAEEVQDGDELELDKGVLIEVGERMSTTQTDISNLFEKRRSSQNSPQSRNNYPGSDPQAPRPLVSTPSTATSTPLRPSASSQPFRSLNDLLGIRKAPAAAHISSPYEERHRPPPSRPAPPPSNIPEPSELERAPKRQKASTGKTNEKFQSDVVDLTGNENGSESPSSETSRPSKVLSNMPPPREKPTPASTTRPTRPDPPVLNPIQPSPAEPTTNHPSNEAAAAKEKRPRQTESQNQQHSEPARQEKARPQEPASIPRIPMKRTRNKFMYSTIMQQQRQSSAAPAENSQPASKPAKPQKPRPQKPTQEIESTNTEFLPSDSTQSIIDEMDDTGLANDSTRDQFLDKENLPAKRAFVKPLRKSISDPSALTNKRSLQTRPTLMRSAVSALPEEPEVDEEGPWTSEALDLFDYWPKGLLKPA